MIFSGALILFYTLLNEVIFGKEFDMAVLTYVGWNGYSNKKEIEYCKDRFESVTKAYKAAIDFVEVFKKEFLDTERYEYGHLDISGNLVIQWIGDKGSNTCYPVCVEIC